MTRVQSVHSAIITWHRPMVSQIVQAVPTHVNMLQHVCRLCLDGDKNHQSFTLLIWEVDGLRYFAQNLLARESLLPARESRIRQRL